MENAVDALKMAAAILIFVIAIASSFSLFGTAKRTADSIITMRDKQVYLESAELDDGILYTSTSSITGETGLEEDVIETKFGVTKKGDRIVGVEDVISTIYRYSKEKYGVTIVKEEDGTVMARFDSNTEQIMSVWYSIRNPSTNIELDKYIRKMSANTKTDYVEPQFSVDILKSLYAIDVSGAAGIKCGAPWYGNEEEIQKRIACDLKGGEADEDKYIKDNQKYKGKGLISQLEGRKIIEVTNEIDNSTYLEDNGETTDLLQQYQMPTLEIVYIIT